MTGKRKSSCGGSADLEVITMGPEAAVPFKAFSAIMLWNGRNWPVYIHWLPRWQGVANRGPVVLRVVCLSLQLGVLCCSLLCRRLLLCQSLFQLCNIHSLLLPDHVQIRSGLYPLYNPSLMQRKSRYTALSTFHVIQSKKLIFVHRQTWSCASNSSIAESAELIVSLNSSFSRRSTSSGERSSETFVLGLACIAPEPRRLTPLLLPALI